MEYAIKALAELAGVTTRTLRWYDREGLLHPLRTTQAGYRIYGPEQVDRLQQILFYRERGVELADIRSMLDDPAFDRQTALQSHLAALEDRRARLDALILTVHRTIESTKGGHTMSDREKFEAFKRDAIAENEAKYGAEIRRKYGEAAVEGSNKLLEKMSREEYDRMSAIGEALQRRLEAAVTAGVSPEGEEGRAIAALHREWLSFTWPSYSPQAHAGLAEMYVADERFTAYYDKSVPGCAAFLCRAVAAYAASL